MSYPTIEVKLVVGVVLGGLVKLFTKNVKLVPADKGLVPKVKTTFKEFEPVLEQTSDIICDPIEQVGVDGNVISVGKAN